MTQANQAQAEYWRSASGRKWIEHERALDVAMAGMLETLLEAAALSDRERVIDVGCGTGAGTIAAARQAANGHALGLDISPPLLDRAASRARAEGVQNTSFVLADAQTHGFRPGTFDVLVSRLGMSFFEDTVEALRNLASALVPGGRMAFVSWAGVAENPWFSVPRDAAVARLGKAPGSDPAAPGPLAFRDADRVAGLMQRAGLSEVQAGPVTIVLTPPDGSAGAARAASSVGPAARIMKAHAGTEADAAAIEDAVRKELEHFEQNGDMRIPAVVNLFTCRVGA